MVKNKFGGNKHKGFARKFANAKPDNKLRMSQNEFELYGIAIKMLGNNMFECMCIDGVSRLGHIRGKFAGRGKRDNMISIGTWVLIGLREWDTTKSDDTKCTKKKLQQCDLLEVYTDYDIERLKDNVDANWAVLVINDGTTKSSVHNIEESIYFATEKDIERERLIDEMNSTNVQKIKLTTSVEQEINIDDI
jgi:translation initiation factor 1A